MRRAAVCAVVGLLLPAMAFAQAAAGLAFEIADIHASPRTTNLAMRGNIVRDGRYELRNATMVDLIRTAYGVDADKVVGFTFNFSPIGAVQGGAGPAGDIGQGGGAASDPTGAMSLLQALPRQLGLKLELQKRPNPVLVIDAAERLVAN